MTGDVIDRPHTDEARTALRAAAPVPAPVEASQRARRLAVSVAERGYAWVEQAHFVRDESGLHPAAFIDTHAPAGWGEHYRRLRGWEDDPRLPPSCLRGLPHFWNAAALALPLNGLPSALVGSAVPLARRVAAGLVRHGVVSGLTLAIALRPQGHCAVLHFMSAQPRGVPLHSEGLLALMNLASALADELAGPPAVAPAPAPAAAIRIDGLQLQVARCVAQGLCDKEVASRVDAGRHAVDYHLRELRRKFGARNRVELALQIERYLAARPG